MVNEWNQINPQQNNISIFDKYKFVIAEHNPDEFSIACSEVMNLVIKHASESNGKFTDKNILEELLSSIEYAEDDRNNKTL